MSTIFNNHAPCEFCRGFPNYAPCELCGGFSASQGIPDSQGIPESTLPLASSDPVLLYEYLLMETPMPLDASSTPYRFIQCASNAPSQLDPHADVADRPRTRNASSGSSSLPLPLPVPHLTTFPSPKWRKIPQSDYSHGGRQWDFRPSAPILFQVNGYPGMNMDDALRKKFTALEGRDDLMFPGVRTAISCRLLFPGYPPNKSTQISTKRWNGERDPVTRAKLSHEVAKRLNQYLDSMRRTQVMDASTEEHWRIGEGFMHLRRMFLARLVPVSNGSWQPEIWVLDPAM